MSSQLAICFFKDTVHSHAFHIAQNSWYGSLVTQCSFGCCDPTVQDDASNYAYAIFVEVARVWALTIDFTTGTIIKQVPVQNFNNWGEMARVFAYDANRNVFYYLEANFTSPRPSGGRSITLYTVDPITGRTKVATVQGMTDFPAGRTRFSLPVAPRPSSYDSSFFNRGTLLSSNFSF